MSVPPSIEVIYESTELLAVNKPEGLSTIPERDLAVASVRRLLEAQRSEQLWVVHRLDKEVSGLLLFARTAEAHRELSMQFETRTVKKRYLALVHGLVRSETGNIETAIREFGSGRMGVDPRGKASRTSFRVLARGPIHTLLEAEPHTGRRHQLRVHLYSTGHPIAGDARYGEREQAALTARLMLHSWQLALPALSSSAALNLEAPPPESFVAELSRAGLKWPLA